MAGFGGVIAVGAETLDSLALFCSVVRYDTLYPSSMNDFTKKIV